MYNTACSFDQQQHWLSWPWTDCWPQIGCTLGENSNTASINFDSCLNVRRKYGHPPWYVNVTDFDIVELFFLIKVRKCLLHFIGRGHTPDTRVVYSRMTQELFCRGDWSNSCFVPPLNCWSKDQQPLFWHSWRNTSHDANASTVCPRFQMQIANHCQLSVSTALSTLFLASQDALEVMGLDWCDSGGRGYLLETWLMWLTYLVYLTYLVIITKEVKIRREVIAFFPWKVNILRILYKSSHLTYIIGIHQKYWEIEGVLLRKFISKQMASCRRRYAPQVRRVCSECFLCVFWVISKWFLCVFCLFCVFSGCAQNVLNVLSVLSWVALIMLQWFEASANNVAWLPWHGMGWEKISKSGICCVLHNSTTSVAIRTPCATNKPQNKLHITSKH